MNDEIKEILDYLKDEKWDYYPSDMTPYKVFFMEERDKLLDYITNLQQELEEYKDTETYSKRFLYKANKDRLNANLELVKELEDYKSRCEKADWWLKEMLKQAKSDETKAIINGTLELLLNGRSDE